MSLFKKRKLKTEEVTVQGEKFILTEPNALNMCMYWDFVEKEHATVKDDSTNLFRVQINAKTALMLTAVCLVPQYPKMSVEEIYNMLCGEITVYSDVNIFSDAADKVTELKTETEEVTQDGNSDTD